METIQMVLLICAGAGMFILMGVIPLLANNYSLNGIKSKTVGDGQYGTARFASEAEIKRTFTQVPYEPALWKTSAQGTGDRSRRAVFQNQSDGFG